MSDKEMISFIKSTQEQIEHLLEETSHNNDCAVAGSLQSTP